ncbi:MAG: metal ABC transporter ATP-binding protein [Microbacteriaceae bacterium]
MTESPILEIRDGGLGFGARTLWNHLNLTVGRGEFVAVLGSNGSGKTSLLKSILGQQKLDEGAIFVDGHPVHRGNRSIGYIPQQKLASQGVPLRGRDLVTFGINGHRAGLPFTSASEKRRVSDILDAVGAATFADQPIGSLSGGEQQRLRVGQALVGNPSLLLCDEPLISLDLANQRAVAQLIDYERHDRGTAVVFVTHDINPILGMVDRIVYLAAGKFSIGAPTDVLRSEVLSELYGTPVDVIHSNDRVFVAGAPDAGDHVHHPEEH